MTLRFDDSLETVLSAEMSTPFGAQSAWRQLVDLVGRRRVPADATAIDKLVSLRAQVPTAVRAASARALAFARPPADLVRLFLDEDVAIVAPVLRMATLQPDEWIALLPAMSPASRSVLRHRRDLPATVRRALDTFGPDDFRLTSAVQGAQPDAGQLPLDQKPADAADVADEPDEATPPTVRAADPAPSAPQFGESPFVSVGAIAFGLPVVAEALRRAEPDAPVEPVAPPPEGPFQIAELVARIDAYQRRRDEAPGIPLLRGEGTQPALFDCDPVPAQHFRFETDASGVVRWIEGAARAPLIGLSLDLAALPGASRVDGVAGGAFRRRAGFADARLVVDGGSDAAGEWRITGLPVFDRDSGRFTGYRGTARRPRVDESAAPLRAPSPTTDALRQLVHELRTPTNAIAGFAEMIETQLLGPVPDVYRDQAGTIRNQAAGLLTAIDDIDLAARLESHSLDLRAERVPLAPLLAQVTGDLAPLAALRGTELLIDTGGSDLAIAGDERAVERLIGRLMATLVASGALHEHIHVVATLIGDTTISLRFDRPRALAAFGNSAILTIDAEAVAEAEGAPLLGTGFALRLACNLAAELGGLLSIDDRHLTLLLPAAVDGAVEQVSSN
jgi:signal transduction histidine kinase